MVPCPLYKYMLLFSYAYSQTVRQCYFSSLLRLTPALPVGWLHYLDYFSSGLARLGRFVGLVPQGKTASRIHGPAAQSKIWGTYLHNAVYMSFPALSCAQYNLASKVCAELRTSTTHAGKKWHTARLVWLSSMDANHREERIAARKSNNSFSHELSNKTLATSPPPTPVRRNGDLSFDSWFP